MLACAQDIFFASSNSDSNGSSDHFNDAKDKRSRQYRHVNSQFQPQQHMLPKDLNSSKEKEEVCYQLPCIKSTSVPNDAIIQQQVWPPDVEDAFIKGTFSFSNVMTFFFFTDQTCALALETIPKLGRRKILVNGKPCGKHLMLLFWCSSWNIYANHDFQGEMNWSLILFSAKRARYAPESKYRRISKFWRILAKETRIVSLV